jgi:hypothetical protein
MWFTFVTLPVQQVGSSWSGFPQQQQQQGHWTGPGAVGPGAGAKAMSRLKSLVVDPLQELLQARASPPAPAPLGNAHSSSSLNPPVSS